MIKMRSPGFSSASLRLLCVCCALLLLGTVNAARAATGAPVLLTDPASTRALALESVSLLREPFSPTRSLPFGKDNRTHIILFAMNTGLLQGEGANAVTADAEDSAHNLYPLKVVLVAPVPGYEWMTEVVVRLNDQMGDVGDVLVRINIHGMASNRVRVGIGHIGGSLTDDAGSVPTPAVSVPPGPQPSPYPTPNAYTVASSTEDTVRFLEQSTFGATPALIQRVQQIGFNAFLNEQFTAPVSQYPALPALASTNATTVCGQTTDPGYQACVRDNFTMYPNQVAFFRNALSQNVASDQLRQRVAFALGQIFVTSGLDVNLAYAMRDYQQLLMNDALTNYRQILYDVTLSPMMGHYLNMANNNKPAGANTPNENYAREVLQLFSIGLYQLNQDGTLKLDAAGQPIPTYDQDTVEGFAYTFTGWTYQVIPGATVRNNNPPYYVGQMYVVPQNHATTAKELLDGFQIPATREPSVAAANQELNQAIDNIFNHPNVGPFIARQLIQHLVTSNPSPAYVGRVAAAFNDNGQGVRGDMKAVIKAVLFDPEARGDVKTAPDYGHLREPVLYVTSVLRALNATSDGDLTPQTNPMGQNLFYQPSVFNYYSPNYKLPGKEVYAPEFGIQTTAAAITRSNFINTITYSRIGTAPNGTSIDLSTLQTVANNPAQLVATLDGLLMHNSMSPAMRGVITAAVTNIPVANTLQRAQTALYLVATSSQYQVER
ncbi:MAG TPA: DUF1800 domain-containing protein [Pyrinomonadaceae bacterium]|jgi:uncharacterized protein (DUF1800 family)